MSTPATTPRHRHAPSPSSSTTAPRTARRRPAPSPSPRSTTRRSWLTAGSPLAFTEKRRRPRIDPALTVTDVDSAESGRRHGADHGGNYADRPGRARLHRPERDHRHLQCRHRHADPDRQRQRGQLPDRAALGDLRQRQRQPVRPRPAPSPSSRTTAPRTATPRPAPSPSRRSTTPRSRSAGAHARVTPRTRRPRRSIAAADGHRRRQHQPGRARRCRSPATSSAARTCSASPTRTASAAPSTPRPAC